MQASFSLTTLSPDARAVAVLGAAALVATLLDLPAVASLASVTSLILPLVRLARRHANPGSAVTPVLATFTAFWLGVLIATELLSMVGLLGSRAAWISLTLGAAMALHPLASRPAPVEAPPERPGFLPLAHVLKEPWIVVVGPVGLVLGLVFAQSAYLNTFTGINYADGQASYMARSIRYLQDGTVWRYASSLDFFPYLHQTTSAYLLLFFGTESSILLLSTLFGGCVCMVLFDLARMMHPPVSLAVLAGLSPLTVPIFNLHLGTSNFDVHTTLFLLLAIYFLFLAIRTARLRYVLLAASSTALALATKPTFWFAAAGLATLWLGATIALATRCGWRPVVRIILIAAVVVALGGVQILRNAWTHGFLISPGPTELGQTDAPTLQGRLDTLKLNTLALTTMLLTPELVVKGALKERVERTFQAIGEGIGLSLPNQTLSAYPDRGWREVLDHLREPFNSDKAGFGTVVPLLVAPAVVIVIADVVRRRSVFSLQSFVLLHALLYLVSMGLSLKYTAEMVRYTIELAIPLLILVPLLFSRLPLMVGMGYLVVASAFLLTDAYQTYHKNEQRPPSTVTLVPREDQYPTFIAPERFTFYEAARLLDQKYPVEEWPEIFLFKEGQFHPVLFEYPFLDPVGKRRLTYWFGNLSEDRPAWPGPFLVLNPTIADDLRTRFAGQVALDRLSDEVWVALPRDRLRVLWSIVPVSDTTPSAVRLVAVVDGERYRQPEYRFTTADWRDGRQVAILRDFSPDPGITLPSGTLARILEVRVEARDAGTVEATERVTVPQRRMMRR